MQALYVDVRKKQRVGFIASDAEGAIILEALACRTYNQCVISGIRDDQSPFFLVGSAYNNEFMAEFRAAFPQPESTPEEVLVGLMPAPLPAEFIEPNHNPDSE